MADTTPANRAQALIDGINAEVDGEIAAILKDAAEEAVKVRSQAQRKAREKTRTAIAELRRTRDRALGKVTASLETERRQMQQASAFAALSEGLSGLPDALQHLWQEPPTRKAWCDAVVQESAARLLPGEWLLEHPENLQKAEVQALKTALRKASGKPVKAVVQPGLTAGLRLRADTALVDASAAAIAKDRQALGAQFLSALDELNRKDTV